MLLIVCRQISSICDTVSEINLTESGRKVPIAKVFIFHLILPYLGLYNAQDFAQILYLVGGVRIINRNHVFHSFPDREITCPPCFFVYMQS